MIDIHTAPSPREKLLLIERAVADAELAIDAGPDYFALTYLTARDSHDKRYGRWRSAATDAEAIVAMRHRAALAFGFVTAYASVAGDRKTQDGAMNECVAVLGALGMTAHDAVRLHRLHEELCHDMVCALDDALEAEKPPEKVMPSPAPPAKPVPPAPPPAATAQTYGQRIDAVLDRIVDNELAIEKHPPVLGDVYRGGCAGAIEALQKRREMDWITRGDEGVVLRYILSASFISAWCRLAGVTDGYRQMRHECLMVLRGLGVSPQVSGAFHDEQERMWRSVLRDTGVVPPPAAGSGWGFVALLVGAGILGACLPPSYMLGVWITGGVVAAAAWGLSCFVRAWRD